MDDLSHDIIFYDIVDWPALDIPKNSTVPKTQYNHNFLGKL